MVNTFSFSFFFFFKQDPWLTSLSSSSLKENLGDSFSPGSGGKASVEGGSIKLLHLSLCVNSVLLRILFVKERLHSYRNGTCLHLPQF